MVAEALRSSGGGQTPEALTGFTLISFFSPTLRGCHGILGQWLYRSKVTLDCSVDGRHSGPKSSLQSRWTFLSVAVPFSEGHYHCPVFSRHTWCVYLCVCLYVFPRVFRLYSASTHLTLASNEELLLKGAFSI